MDLRASCALGTVKNRIMMCGRPAAPSIQASPRENLVQRVFQEQPRLQETLAVVEAGYRQGILSRPIRTWSWMLALLTISARNRNGFMPDFMKTRKLMTTAARAAPP